MTIELTKLNRAAKMLYTQMLEALRTDFDYIVIESTGECFFIATLLAAKLQNIKGIKTVTEVINGRKNFSKRRCLFVTDLLTDQSFARISLTEFKHSCIASLFGAGRMREDWQLDTRVFVGGDVNTSLAPADFEKLWRSKL